MQRVPRYCFSFFFFPLISLLIILISPWILEISWKAINSYLYCLVAMLWDFLWWGKENTEPSGKQELNSRAGRWWWYLCPTSSSADPNQSEACLYCLATLCLICILNYAGEHKVPLLHHRKDKISFFKRVFWKTWPLSFLRFLLINDPR